MLPLSHRLGDQILSKVTHRAPRLATELLQGPQGDLGKVEIQALREARRIESKAIVRHGHDAGMQESTSQLLIQRQSQQSDEKRCPLLHTAAHSCTQPKQNTNRGNPKFDRGQRDKIDQMRTTATRQAWRRRITPGAACGRQSNASPCRTPMQTLQEALDAAAHLAGVGDGEGSLYRSVLLNGLSCAAGRPPLGAADDPAGTRLPRA